MKKHYQALMTEDGESWIGIGTGQLMISPIPMLLPFSVDRATIENAISNLKVESTDGPKEELRYKLVGISLEILTN
jgi:hypothetical protein